MYHDDLKTKAHLFAKSTYAVTRNFPKEELYGITSQLRRASLSVVLNYIEGFARRRDDNCKVYKNFLEIAYGSLREAKYLIFFSFSEGYLNKIFYDKLIKEADDIGGMLWGIIQKIK